jgi:hypothetical protein
MELSEPVFSQKPARREWRQFTIVCASRTLAKSPVDVKAKYHARIANLVSEFDKNSVFGAVHIGHLQGLLPESNSRRCCDSFLPRTAAFRNEFVIIDSARAQ